MYYHLEPGERTPAFLIRGGPEKKVTVPVARMPAATVGVTTAVNVTVWPKSDGFGEEVTVVALSCRRSTSKASRRWGNTDAGDSRLRLRRDCEAASG